MGYKFTPNPAFTPEHVLSSDNFIIIGNLSKALIMAQSIKYLVTECVFKVRISQEINTLCHLWQRGNSFYIKHQIALSNNFTNLLCINYFNCNIAKYGKNLVNNVLKAILPLLNKEQMGVCIMLKYITGSVLLI